MESENPTFSVLPPSHCFYHVLTNEPPVDARKRFIQPASLIPPRQINSAIAPRTEQAILWAMSLHPDDRPESIGTLSRFLFEGGSLPAGAGGAAAWLDVRPLALFGSRTDAILAWTAGSLLFLSLVATLIQ